MSKFLKAQRDAEKRQAHDAKALYKTYQYNDDAVCADPNHPAYDKATRWIAARSEVEANEAARQRGWRQCGGEIYNEHHTPQDSKGMKVFGIDLILK